MGCVCVCERVEGDIVWVEIEVRRLTGWVAPTPSHCLCPDSEGVVAVNWHRQSDHRWIDRVHCVHTTGREDGIVSYLVERGQGRAGVHAAWLRVSKWQADD